jgi:NAD(P)-dependent dehydrogenase (short-subunit alcohol dehydrogenase family)
MTMLQPTINLHEKRALVTGANTGIGAGIVRTLAACGARVAINYFAQPELAEELVNEIHLETEAGTALPVWADVCDEASVQAMFTFVAEKFGGLDILVNNAGVESMFAAVDLPIQEWDRVMNTDLRGAFLCSQAAARIMIQQGKGGVIINNQSIHDNIARLGAVHYCVAKAGMQMLTKALALEWAEFGIRVAAVSPGAINSGHPEVKKMLSIPEIRQVLSQFPEWVPLKKIGEVQDVANAVAFLASDLAGYITGTTIYIDGGYSINLVRYDARKWSF